MVELGDGPVWALGLMSGTSLDGVDAALLKTDGVEISAFGPGAERPYRDNKITFIRTIMKKPHQYHPPNNHEFNIKLNLTTKKINNIHTKTIT